MVAPVPAKRGRKPAATTAPVTGQVQSLTRGLKLLEWIAESNGSVALTELRNRRVCLIPRLTVYSPPCSNRVLSARLVSWATGP